MLPTIAELGSRLRSRACSAVDLANEAIERIEDLDGPLNALITTLHERAFASAEQADRDLKAGIDRGPLHGIPVGIKDLIDIADVPTTYASRALQPAMPSRSAVLVEHLEREGAVIVAKTNLLEFAYGSVHPDVGQTNNPWDRARTSGGSSGGSAAGLAVGFFAGSVGTDTGGSIRGPASYCGVAGLKPTYGLVETTGVFPLCWSLDHAGPMARTPACAHAMLDAMTGGSTLAPALPLKGLRFGIVRQHRAEPALHAGVARAFDDAVALLRAAGAVEADPALPDLAPCDQALLDILLPEASVVHEKIHAANAAGYGPQTRAIIEQGFASSAVAMVRAERFRRSLRHAVEEAFGRFDVLLSPTIAWVAPREDPAVAGDEGEIEMRFVAPWNLTGNPALSIPCGFAEGGLPAGLQLTGRLGDDARLLRIGEALHQALALPLTPPGIDRQSG
jgi:aspartyl-tRNA(Asn)/glutamyl-tRNA(Gln) amidotransferase subunit A